MKVVVGNIGIVLALIGFKLVLEHTRSWHMPSMLLGSSEERNWVVVLAGLEILGELGVLFMGEEPEVRKSPLCPQVPFGVDRVLYVVVYLFFSTKGNSCLDSNRYHIIDKETDLHPLDS